RNEGHHAARPGRERYQPAPRAQARSKRRAGPRTRPERLPCQRSAKRGAVMSAPLVVLARVDAWEIQLGVIAARLMLLDDQPIGTERVQGVLKVLQRAEEILDTSLEVSK